MECKQIKDNLLHYVKEEMIAEESHAVAQHLEKCPQCRALAQSISGHLQLYQGLPTLEPTRNASSLMSRISSDSTVPCAAERITRRVVFAATILIVLSLCYYSFFLQRSTLEVLQGNIYIGEKAAFHRPIEIEKGTRLATRGMETAKCRIGEKIWVNLGSDSSLEFRSLKLFRLHRGQIYVKVDKVPLVINTAMGRIEIQGTIFSLDLSKARLKLRVISGQVNLLGAKGKILVKAGQTAQSDSRNTTLISTPGYRALPWWEDTPLSLATALRSDPQNRKGPWLTVNMKNCSDKKIQLIPFAGDTPHLMLHIQEHDTTRSRYIPLRAFLSPVGKEPISIMPGDTHSIQCDISTLATRHGRYGISVVYRKHREFPYSAYSTPLYVDLP